MKNILFVLFFCTVINQVQAQVGIGTENPRVGLHVQDSAVVFSASGDIAPNPILPNLGQGRRMLWHPAKAAFRAGYVGSFGSTYWDNASIGNYSFAAGSNTRASGSSSFAVGLATTASGDESVALGNNGTASGARSFGFNGTATGVGAVAIGSGAQATQDDALAMGPSSIAGGLASIVLGPSIANGSFAVAIGLQNSASGNFSVAIGKNARTARRQGAMVLGDGSAGFSSDSVYATANNQMTMRFVGGYRLFTNVPLTSGVEIAAGGGSWSSVSDRDKKENFVDLDPEIILQKLVAIPVRRWNYKSQPIDQHHIGPMAQDFHEAYVLDGPHADKTINTVDIDGVNMISIQALAKRTSRLKEENEQLKNKLATLEERLKALENAIAKSAKP